MKFLTQTTISIFPYHFSRYFFFTSFLHFSSHIIFSPQNLLLIKSSQACDLMSIRLIKVPMDPVTCRIDLNAVQRAITSNTIMMYGSAPSFPQVKDRVSTPFLSFFVSLSLSLYTFIHVFTCLPLSLSYSISLSSIP